jgi:sec-independent protein translocase protein TatC
MNFGSDRPDPDDYFSDTRMSFGDHIEELRLHLWKAIAGFLVALFFSFFIGNHVLAFIEAPVKAELQHYWDKYYLKRNKEVLDALKEATIQGGEPFKAKARVDVAVLKEILGLPQKDANNQPGSQWRELPFEIVDPVEWANGFQKYSTIVGRQPGLATMNVQEAFMVYFQVCVVTGFVLASPWVFYQIWSFIAAGLFPHEKRYVNIFLPVSIGLFLAGVMLCEFMVIPNAVAALLWFNEWLNLEPELRLSEWLSFAILMPLIFGIAFQTPLAMLFMERIGLVDVPKFRSMRKIAWFVLAFLSALVIPSTDIPSMLFLWLPMCFLYELGIWMCLMAPRHPAFDDDDVPKSDELIEV